MKRLYYTLLLGIAMTGMTTITAWSQPTIMITETTPISVTFHFGTGTTSISFFVTEGDASPSSTDPVRVINRMADSDVTATVEGLTPATLYTIRYTETGVAVVMTQMFTTASLSLDFLFELIESRTEAFETEVAAHDTRLTTLESHEHASIVTLQSQTHTHANQADLDAQSHTHANQADLDLHSHTHTNQDALDEHSHDALTAQSHTHTNADLDLHSHTHTNLTMLEEETPHTHTNLTMLEEETPHTHTDLPALEAKTPHTHTDLPALEAETPHTHTNKAALDAHSHTDLAEQSDLDSHTHEDNDGGRNLLGVQEEGGRLAFIPNPTNDTFTMQGLDSYERVNVYNARGRVVHMQTRGLVIDLARYPAGVYIVRVYTKQGMHTRKLVKK